jgi:iron complex outermembrane receptor protein
MPFAHRRPPRFGILLAPTVLLVLLGPLAHAAARPTVRLQKIRVRGEGLAQVSAHVAEPVYVLTAKMMKRMGYATVGQVLSQFPFNGSAASLNTAYTKQFTNGGEENVSLHSLGHNRVLVLVNGRRWVSGLKGDVDLNAIPLPLVSRIVIYDASGGARYGAEAIGGVVDILLKKEFHGFEAGVYGGIYHGDGHWDGGTDMVSLTGGSGNARRGIMFSLSYLDEAALPSGDRTISSVPLAGTGVTRGSPANPWGDFEFYATGGPFASDPDCQGTPVPLCNLTRIPGTSGNGTNDFAPFTIADNFNTAPFNDLLIPLERTNAYLEAYRRLPHGMRLSVSGFFNRRDSAQQSSPPLLFIGKDGLPINIAANQPYNPFGIALDSTGPDANLVSLGRAMVEDGPLLLTETVNTYRFDAVLKGVNQIKDFGRAPWTWDVYGIVAQNDVTNNNHGRFDLAHLALALGNPEACAAQPGCVPLDLFGGPGSVTPEMLRYIAFTETNTIDNTQRIVAADLHNRDLLNLPAGPLGFSFGYQYREHLGVSNPNPIAQFGEDSASPGIPVLPTVGGYRASSAYLGFDVPLLRRLPGAHLLTVSLIHRFSHYSNFGFHQLSQVSVLDHVTRTFTLRLLWAQGFREPDIHDTDAALVEVPTAVSDPCSGYTSSSPVAATCAAAGVPPGYRQTNPQVNVLTGGNPNLQPESAINKVVGFVWTPSSLPLSVQADYYRIAIDNAIGSPGANTVLEECYLDDNPAACTLVTRNPDGSLALVRDTSENLGTIFTDGIDGAARYRFPSTPYGDFGLSLVANWVRNWYTSTPNPKGGATVVNLDGIERGGTSFPLAVPRWRAIGAVTWDHGPWSATTDLEYIGSLNESCSDFLNGTPYSLTALGDCSDPDTKNNALSRNHIGSVFYVNASIAHRFSGARTEVEVGVHNLLDRTPPISTQQVINSYDPTLYDVPGRFFYVGAQTRF